MCVYQQAANPAFAPGSLTIGDPGAGGFFPPAGAGRAGAILLALGYKGFAYGTWAVTG
jgi:hypothetical protein